MVNTDGTFTYTPTTAAREAAAAADAAETGANQDSFTVTINYGVPEDVGGVATSLLVTVPISPSSPAPQPGLDPSYTLSAPDDTGVVTGVVSAGPTVDYPVVYFGSTRSRQGTVVVNTDGTFTYTPTTAAREAAAAADAAETGANQDSFTVTINYGVPEDVGGIRHLATGHRPNQPRQRGHPHQRAGGGRRGAVIGVVEPSLILETPPAVVETTTTEAAAARHATIAGAHTLQPHAIQVSGVFARCEGGRSDFPAAARPGAAIAFPGGKPGSESH